MSNYPVPEGVGKEVILAGAKANIDVSWQGPDYLAEVLQRVKSAQALFPNLEVNGVMEQLAIIIAKLESKDAESTRVPITWVPRDEQELKDIAEQRPPYWEYLLFAGHLRQGKAQLDPKWRDYKNGYAPRTGRYFNDVHSAMSYLVGTFIDVRAITASVTANMNDDGQAEAFGPPGEPGNPLLIGHLAKRILTSYEELLDWAAGLRGIAVPEEMSRAFALAAVLVERPATDIRNFVDNAVVQLERLPELLSRPRSEPLQMDLTLRLTADEDAAATFSAEMQRLRQKFSQFGR